MTFKKVQVDIKYQRLLLHYTNVIKLSVNYYKILPKQHYVTVIDVSYLKKNSKVCLITPIHK